MEYSEYSVKKLEWDKSKTYLEYLEEKGYIVDYTSDIKRVGTVILNGRVYNVNDEEKLIIEYKGKASKETLLMPKITKFEKTVKNSGATVDIELKDKKGVTLKYTIQKDGEEEKIEESPYIEDVTYTFNNLEASTTYIVTVEAKNEYGITIRKSTIKTISLSDLTTGKASFEIKTNTKWQSEITAKIISSYSEANTILQYKIKNGEWKEYTGEFKVYENVTLYGRYYCKTTGEIGYAFTLKIDVIDDVKPQLQIIEKEVTSKTIKVNVDAKDSELGMPSRPEYNYYIGTSESDYILKDTLITNSYTYENLNSNTTYYIKITAVDKAGNEGEVLETITTNPPILVSNITLDKKSVTAGITEKVQLNATVNPDNAEDKTVKWTTSDSSIATVSNTGLVTPVKAGIVTITCLSTDGGATADCKFNIVNGSTIYTRADLEAIARNTTGSYILMNDIDLSGREWTPIPRFNGTLDGNGHSIKNLTIKNTLTGSQGYNVGFFGEIADPAKIMNIKFENVSVSSASAYVGVLAGGSTCASGSSGHFKNPSSDKTVTIKKVGIESGEVIAYGRVGSLLGRVLGGNLTITDSYSHANITSTNKYDASGLVRNDEATNFIRSYWDGRMSATRRISPIEGMNDNENAIPNSNATITNCYYNNEKFTITTATKAAGLTTAQFANSNSFNGWDFENTWIIKNGVPELRIFVKD